MPNRPQLAGSRITTPKAETMIRLLGPGLSHAGLMLTSDETRALNKLYGFTPEPPTERPPRPERKPDPEGTSAYERKQADDAHKRAVTAWEKWEDPRAILQAGADRNMVRHAESDGLRLVAWLAKFVPAGGDPLKTLIQLASDAGYDVPAEDVDWAEDET